MSENKSFPKCFDAYLLYAISTNFENFKQNFQTDFEKRFELDDDKFRLLLLVELDKSGQATEFTDKMRALGHEFGVEIGPDVGDVNTTRYVTMRCRPKAVLDETAQRCIWDPLVSRVELSLPVQPSSTPAMFPRKFTIEDRANAGKDPPASFLIGLLDDGCPFASAQFLRTLGSGVSTRVLGIWDQNQDKQPVMIGGRAFGQSLSDFDYGLEYRRDFAPSTGAQPIGLDEWMGLHLTTAGIDEDGCYAQAGFTTLARRESHGAHVMDVFAGLVPTSARIGPSHPGQDHRDPPTWTPGRPASDPACDADVVFVQFPDVCIRDATGVWLKTYVIHGIQYILSFADPIKTKNVIINLSYGPTTGPHDGTAELETALTALVAEYNGINKSPRLEIVLAAGNAYLSDGHVVFTNESEQPGSVEWTWRVPPDNTVLSFAEIWMDDADADGVVVTLTSPSGVPLQSASSVAGFTLPTVGGTAPELIGPIVWGEDRMWLLEVGPTIAAPYVTACEHGDWKIKIEHLPENAEVHAYVARSDPNMGVRTGAKRSQFIDPGWEFTQAARADLTRVDGEFDRSGSLVRRDGTLNGIATAKKHRVHVAGGYVLTDGRKASYSSEGPARRGPRVGPDFALPCDESFALTGMRAGGNRSGSVFRLAGTSVAAPQLARQALRLARGLSIPPPNHVPSPNDVVEIEKRGGGDMEPP
jgi:hypothetical protein